MKRLCSNTYPWGQNLLLLSVTGMERIQRCQLSGKVKKNSVTWVKKNIFFLFVASEYREPAGTCVDNPESRRSICVSCRWNQLTSSACVWVQERRTLHTHILSPMLKGAMPGRLKLSAQSKSHCKSHTPHNWFPALVHSAVYLVYAQWCPSKLDSTGDDKITRNKKF